MVKIVNRKIDELGRIVIPREIRNNLNIKSYDELNIEVNNDSIILTKKNNEKNVLLKFEEWLKDWKDSLKSQAENIEGLDIYEEHTLENLETILSRLEEFKRGAE